MKRAVRRREGFRQPDDISFLIYCDPAMWTSPIQADLAEPDRRVFEFIADQGYRYHGDGRSVLMRAMTVTKPNVVLTDTELTEFGRAIQAYLDELDSRPPAYYEIAKIFRDEDFKKFEGRYVYKFVTESTYRRFISKGSFLLSSLARYREFERQGNPAGDRFEGSSIVAYAVDDRELCAVSVAGFDTLVFSASSDAVDAEEKSCKFGPVVLKIDLLPFAMALGAVLNARPQVRLVQYADLKIHRSRLSPNAVLGFPPSLTPRLARALRKKGVLPSVFAKPARFSGEREVRLAFQLTTDAPSASPVNRKRLLDFVERVA